METPTEHWIETLTGLGATGVELMLAHVDGQPRQAHPLVPLLQVASASASPSVDVDLTLTGPASTWTDALFRLLLDTASRDYAPKLYALGNTDFQVSRGLLGISL